MSKTFPLKDFKLAFKGFVPPDPDRDAEREEPRDEDYEEFQRLNSACEALEAELRLVVDPPGASVADTQALAAARQRATDELVATHVEAGRAAIDTLRALVLATTTRVALRLELAAIVYPAAFTVAETQALDLIRTRATTAIDADNADGARGAIAELRTAVDTAERSLDPGVLDLRLAAALTANNVAISRSLYLRMIAENIDVKQIYHIKLKQMGIMPRANLGDGGPLVPDTDQGAHHAWERHTRQGIWARRRVLTAHPTHVAIFASEDRFRQAVAATPTARRSWRNSGGGRVDADAAHVHYQAVQLGDSVGLFSCYPLGDTAAGRQFRREDIEVLLREAESFEEFSAALDLL